MKTYLITIPTLPGTTLDELHGILMTCHGLHHGYLTEKGNSSIALCRNNLADAFLNGTKFDSMIFIDSDIKFTRQDLEYIQEGPHKAVCGVYARKDGSGDEVQYGLGFARVDRDVFSAIVEKKLAQPVLVPGWNRTMHDYFINGAAQDPHGGIAKWVGEDTGFWSLVMQAGVEVRIERRVDLGHIGPFEYKIGDKIVRQTLREKEIERGELRSLLDDAGMRAPDVSDIQGGETESLK